MRVLIEKTNTSFSPTVLPRSLCKTAYKSLIVGLSTDGQYSIRCAPALQHKPPKAEPRYKDEKTFNPFLPPDPNLKVLELQNHVIVLNKYCILPKHFLLVSKGMVSFTSYVMVEFESQANDLSNQDISLIWECLEKMERDGERWLAFYNCGEASGARYTENLHSTQRQSTT